jgi:hypothetical protein
MLLSSAIPELRRRCRSEGAERSGAAQELLAFRRLVTSMKNGRDQPAVRWKGME